MECLKSFNFLVVNQQNEPSPEFYNWTIGGQNFWLYESTNAASSLFVQGFKNINIFKIEISGNVHSTSSTAGVAGIVNNWHIITTVDGQNSNLTTGNITAGGFNMIQQPLNPNLIFTKYQRSICFETPIQSASKITIESLYADGIANQSAVSIKLAWWFNFSVFYTFEGE
jgi:hypothetical protein